MKNRIHKEGFITGILVLVALLFLTQNPTSKSYISVVTIVGGKAVVSLRETPSPPYPD